MFSARRIFIPNHAKSFARSLHTTKLKRNTFAEKEIKNVAVLGGGVMGSGIAQAAAQSGFKVTVVDNDEYTQKCLVSVRRSLDIMSKKKFPNEPKGAKKFIDDVLSNISTTCYFSQGCQDADLVIEAVVENMEVKQNIFKKVDQISPPHAIFATNTSSMSIAEIGSSTNRQSQFGGMHFFHPVWKMQLVEVIKTPKTSKETMDSLCQFGTDLGKKVVKSPDRPGFVVNSLLFPYMMEAVRFFERGHASIEDIDTAMKLGAGYPMGPFQLIDHIGVDILKFAMDGWHKSDPSNPLYFPSETLNNLAFNQKLGKKTGQGFYKYQNKDYRKIMNQRFAL